MKKSFYKSITWDFPLILLMLYTVIFLSNKLSNAIISNHTYILLLLSYSYSLFIKKYFEPNKVNFYLSLGYKRIDILKEKTLIALSFMPLVLFATYLGNNNKFNLAVSAFDLIYYILLIPFMLIASSNFSSSSIAITYGFLVFSSIYFSNIHLIIILFIFNLIANYFILKKYRKGDLI